jgi:hypothetical protein
MFEDILGGTSLSLNSYEIKDDDGFPALYLNFTSSGTVTVKTYGTGNRLIDSDLFFTGNHETYLNIGEYRHTINPGNYKLKAYNSDNNEIFSRSISYKGSILEIVSCTQRWWRKDSSLTGNSLFGLKLYVYNSGDVPVYPYKAQIIMDNEPITGKFLPNVIMPSDSRNIKCFIYREFAPDNPNFEVNILDIDDNILASNSYTVDISEFVETDQFSWNYIGPQEVSLPNPEFLFDYQSTIDRTKHDDYSLYIFDSYDDEYIDIIVDEILSGFSATDIKIINNIASFVQTIEYKSDSEEDDSFEYPRYPVETLFDAQGDCEDKAILTASMLYSLGYDIALLRLPNHMAVGVRLSEEDIPNYEYFIDDYYFLETTTKNKPCGFIPHEYREYNDSVTIYPVSDRPLLIHDWKDGTITIYTNTELGDFVQVTAIVENLGVTTANNIIVEGAFVSLSGHKINYKNTIISSLETGMKKKISLKVDIPDTIITNFKTRIYYNGEIVDEQESASTFP